MSRFSRVKSYFSRTPQARATPLHAADFATTVLVVTTLALSGGLGIIHAVVDRLHGLQVSEDRFQVVIGHILEEPPWHRRIQCTSPDMPSTQRRDEKLLVVIRDAARVGSNIRADHSRTELLATGQFHPSERFTEFVLRC